MISVAMTTYNGEKYVEKQLLTILDQTLPPDEIIICDDDSTDGTEAVVKKLMETYPQITFIRNEERLGYIKNFRKAISLTHGDYIFLADQDDEWELNKFQAMIKIMKNRKCTALCTNFNLIDGDSKPLDRTGYRINPFVQKVREYDLVKIRFGNLIFGNIVQGCTYCMTKEVKEQYLKLESTSVVHDQQIMFVAALMGKVLFYNAPLINYRLHNSNAIGFDKNESNKIELKKPSRKPFMVEFLDELDGIIKIPHKWFYEFLLYLRIPYFVSKIR